MIITGLSIFATSFLNVFFRAFQQLNVMNHQLFWVLPTSFAMAACEVFVIVQAVSQGWGWVIVPLGLGAGLGCISSMLLHKKLREKKVS